MEFERFSRLFVAKYRDSMEDTDIMMVGMIAMETLHGGLFLHFRRRIPSLPTEMSNNRLPLLRKSFFSRNFLSFPGFDDEPLMSVCR